MVVVVVAVLAVWLLSVLDHPVSMGELVAVYLPLQLGLYLLVQDMEVVMDMEVA